MKAGLTHETTKEMEMEVKSFLSKYMKKWLELK